MSLGLQARVDGAVAAASSKLVGVAAVAVRNGEVAYAARGGTSPDAGDRRHDEHTVFEIGSVTKAFTALLLAAMVEAGDVALDEPLATLYPEVDLPVRGRPVTLVDLATHAAGFPRLPPGLLSQALRHRQDPYAAFGPDDVLRALARVRLRSEPGVRVRYSNFGVGVLGEALARRAGTSYADLLAARVTGLLGLADTQVEVDEERRRRRAQGHDRRGRPVPDWSMPGLPGMGALHSTTADLGRFLAAQLLPTATPLADAILLTQEPRVAAGRLGHVGLGWMASPLTGTGLTMHWHNGGTGGTFGFVGFVRERGVGVAMLTNCARPVDRPAGQLLTALAR